MKIEKIDQHEKSEKLKILDQDLVFKNPFKIDQKSTSKFVIKSLNTAHNLALKKYKRYH